MRSALVPILLADPMPWAFKAPYAWDFLRDRARFAGGYRGALANTPNWTFTRASTAYYRNSAGVLVSFASGSLRTGDRGALIEGAATNVFLNSTTPVTQDINFGSTGNRTLSVWGSGSVAVAQNSATITGAGTATQGSPVTFNVTGTGTCTFTVTGSPTIVQVETGAFATSPIATTGSSATRAADSLTVTGVTGLAYPLTFFCEFERGVDTGAAEALFDVSAGASTDEAYLLVGSTDLANGIVNATTQQMNATVTGALAVGTVYKAALRVATNDGIVARGGSLSTQDTSLTVPATPTTIRFGARVSDANPCYGYLRRLAIFSRALSDGELQALTAA